MAIANIVINDLVIFYNIVIINIVIINIVIINILSDTEYLDKALLQNYQSATI